MSNKKTINKDSLGYVSLVLLAICAVAGLFLGVANALTQAPIATKKDAVKQAAFEAVFPGADNWNNETSYSFENYEGVQEVFSCSEGYAIRVIGKGYAGDDIEMVLGITFDGTISGLRIISHSETPGLGAESTKPAFYEQFTGKSAESAFVVSKTGAELPEEIDALTGATKTTNGVIRAVNTVCAFYLNEIGEGR